MLYFLRQTFNMHESHIHSFLTYFPFICYTIQTFDRYRFLVQTSLLRYPLLRWHRLKNGRNTKIRTVLKTGNVTLY